MAVRLSLLLALSLAALLPGCTLAPAHPLPDPYPETLEWARQGAPSGGMFLGLEVRENDSGSLEELFFEPGVRVIEVVANSPAAEAGFEIGDVLLTWDGEPVDDPGTLAALSAAAEGDATPELEVRRGDSVFALSVSLQSNVGAAGEPAELRWRADPNRSLAGWLSGHGGAVLVTADERSPFLRAEIPIGAVVIALGDQPVRSDRSLIRRMQALDPGSEVHVTWQHGPGHEEQKTRLRLYDAPDRITHAGVPVLLNYSSEPDGSASRFSLLDLWFIWLFRYERDEEEKHWSILRFIKFSSGVGELGR